MRKITKSPVHGTAVAVCERGFLILGASGSGKSGLALKMMALGADLVADDQVLMEHGETGVQMSAPDPLKGRVEARNLGILRAAHLPDIILHHVVDMDADAQARLPQLQECEVLGVRIDLINARNVPNLASTLIVLGRGSRSD